MNSYPSTKNYWWIPDVLSISLLFAVGYSAFWFLFSTDPFVYDDHGFHFATLNYVLTKSIPVHHRFIDWNPNWFAGIPELQFYPPGFTFLGAIIYYLTFSTLTPGTIYQIVLIVALFLPGFTAYFLLRKAGFPWWVGLFSGLFLLTYNQTASGILFGIIVGLVDSRYALALFPLILVFFLFCFDNKEKTGNWILLALSIALVILFHPYHSFLPFLGIVAQLYTWSRIGIMPSKEKTKKLILILILGVCLVSFWWIPLFLHSGYVSQMQVWTAGNKMRDLIDSLSDDSSKRFFLILYCISAISLLYGNHTEKRKAILAGLLLTPVFMLIFIFIVRLVLNGLLRNYSIDPWRLQDDFHFSVMLTSGIGIGFFVEKFIDIIKNWKIPFIQKLVGIGLALVLMKLVGIGVVLILIGFLNWKISFFIQTLVEIGLILVLISFLSWKLREKDKWVVTGLLLILLVRAFIGVGYYSVDIMSHCFHYDGFSQFGSLKQTRRILQLDELWDYLKTDSEGRILFTSSRVSYPNLPSRFVTHATALTPDYTGRPILGAVNEPFYTTSSFLYFGVKPPNIIRTEADFLQNQSLMGIPWEKMTEDTFWTLCRRFNITTIVVNDEETKVLDFLSHTKQFIPARQIGLFHIYHLTNYSPSWILSDNNSVDAEVLKFGDDRIDLRVRKSRKDAILMVKMGYYPRWKAYIGSKRIVLKSDERGLMRLELPEGTNYFISIRYESTLAEKMGWSLTVLSAILLMLVSVKWRKRES